MGILERRIAEDNKATGDLATIAGQWVLDYTRLVIDDFDIMIPHQPLIRILQKTAEIILPFEKVKTNMGNFANIYARTIPILLDGSIKKENCKKVILYYLLL